MHRDIPCSSKLLTSRWLAHDHELHERALRETKSTIDTSAPKEYVHIKKKLNKLQKDDERRSQIESDNRILLQKMSVIMRKQHTLDNRAAVEKKSLNREKQKRELEKIRVENQRILTRIRAAKPSYNRVKWEQDRLESEKHLNRICEFPFQKPVAKAGPGYLNDQELAELEASRRVEEDRRAKLELMKRPRKAPTFHQARKSKDPDRGYSPDETGEGGEGRSGAVPNDEGKYDNPAELADQSEDEQDEGRVPTRLTVIVVEAQDLPSADADRLADPWVRVTVGETVFRSAVVDKTLAPVWKDAVFEFANIKADDVLLLEVMDHDTFGDDPMCKVSLPIKDLELDKPYIRWLPLVIDDSVGTQQGQLRVKIKAT